MPSLLTKLTTLLAALAGVIALGACGDSSDDASVASPPAATSTQPAVTDQSAQAGERFPNIREAKLEMTGDGIFTATVTVSSPYDTPERYADGWRVLKAGTGDVLGTHMLDHDHADEQPFSRTQSGLKIPDDVDSVTVQGRDKDNGFGGETVTIDVPRS